jgi:tryptophan 2,3-dioxygenase
MKNSNVHYSTYLQLDKILTAQQTESGKGQNEVHDEMLFIIVHQTYELWFKQILFELDAIMATMQQPALNDNRADLQLVVHRLKRVVTILKTLVQQVAIVETMTPMDFLDFRDMLRPASGFQSWQFKILEAKLGLRFQQRHGKEYYTSQLNPEETALIKQTENAPSLMMLVNSWLERMPFITDLSIWTGYKPMDHITTDAGFFANYEKIYIEGLADAERNNIILFRQIFYDDPPNPDRQLTAKATKNALFIMLYRGYPLLELPFQLLEVLLETDHQLSNWRQQHINMVQRMIGTRIGTGGSSGETYLKAAMEEHVIFKELAQLNSFLTQRSKLPLLPEKLIAKLGYNF